MPDCLPAGRSRPAPPWAGRCRQRVDERLIQRAVGAVLVHDEVLGLAGERGAVGVLVAQVPVAISWHGEGPGVARAGAVELRQDSVRRQCCWLGRGRRWRGRGNRDRRHRLRRHGGLGLGRLRGPGRRDGHLRRDVAGCVPGQRPDACWTVSIDILFFWPSWMSKTCAHSQPQLA